MFSQICLNVALREETKKAISACPHKSPQSQSLLPVLMPLSQGTKSVVMSQPQFASLSSPTFICYIGLSESASLPNSAEYTSAPPAPSFPVNRIRRVLIAFVSSVPV
ncbi:hypothetical protein J6590_080977 [Homalodisca vitripennis]|nr:hypothetical protein J6590_080977 [Homalodisca vitripennis]